MFELSKDVSGKARGHLLPEEIDWAKLRHGKAILVPKKKKKQIDQIVWSIVCVKEIVGDKARKVGWGQIMEGFEYQTDESELCSVGNGEPLKTLEPPE